MTVPRQVWRCGPAGIVALFFWAVLLLSNRVLQALNGHALECCGLQGDELLQCIESQVTRPSLNSASCAHDATPCVEMMSYYSPHIRTHALLSFAINNFYAESHSIAFRMLSPTSGHQFDTIDERWNKVKIIEDSIISALQRTQRLENHYLVWLDADLIIVDMDFDFGAVVAKYPAADIIISREVNPVNGIANSGCFIVKVSHWSLKFFNEWWTARAHTEGMDQHVFQLVYEQQVQEFGDGHVVLLPENEINSAFPAMDTFDDSQSFLHLAGESNFLRAHLFRTAWLALCSSSDGPNATSSCRTGDHNQSHRLPITRQLLDEVDFQSLHEREWRDIRNDVQRAADRFAHPLGADDSKEDILNHLRYRAREAQQSIGRFSCGQKMPCSQSAVSHVQSLILQTLNDIYQLAIRMFGEESMSLNEYLVIDQNSEMKTVYWVQIKAIQEILDSAFELLLIEVDHDRFMSVADHCKVLIRILQEIVSAHALKHALYYEFKLMDFIGKHLARQRDYEESLAQHVIAWEIWSRLDSEFQFHGAGNDVLTSHQEAWDILKYIWRLCDSLSLFDEYCRSDKLVQYWHQYRELLLNNIQSRPSQSSSMELVPQTLSAYPQDITLEVFNGFLCISKLIVNQQMILSRREEVLLKQELLRLGCNTVLFVESDDLSPTQKVTWRTRCAEISQNIRVNHATLLSTASLTLTSWHHHPHSIRDVFDQLMLAADWLGNKNAHNVSERRLKKRKKKS